MEVAFDSKIPKLSNIAWVPSNVLRASFTVGEFKADGSTYHVTTRADSGFTMFTLRTTSWAFLTMRISAGVMVAINGALYAPKPGVTTTAVFSPDGEVSFSDFTIAGDASAGDIPDTPNATKSTAIKNFLT